MEYDFQKMYDDLSYVGNNDPYTQDLYFRVLNQLEELAELQEKGLIKIEH